MKAVFCALFAVAIAHAQPVSTTNFGSQPHDPGVRGGAPASGSPLSGLTTGQLSYFQNGQSAFSETAFVQNAPPGEDNGLGPRFNSNSCVSCHAFPAVGGSSPARESANRRSHRHGRAQPRPLVPLSHRPCA